MLSFYLRFVFQFVFIINSILHLITADNSSSYDRCRSSWHYLPEETLCILFGTSQGGDVTWYDGDKACETSSAQLLTLTDRKKFQLVQQQINDLEDQNELYLSYLQRGAWIGEAKWSQDDLCDSTRTTTEDRQLDCLILAKRLKNQSLCLKNVPCEETHPFICENTAMTEEEPVERPMQRVSWWKCLINVIWCAVDDKVERDKQKQKEEAAAAVAAADLETYIGQFNFDIPDDTDVDLDAQALAGSQEDAVSILGFQIPDWIFMVAGVFIFLFMICICCTVLICVFTKMKNSRLRQRSANRDGSFDSTYSTVSR